MRRLLLGIPLVFALLVPALAAPDACARWKKNHRTLTKHQERPFWDSFEQALGEVWSEWNSEWTLWRGDPENYRDAVHSLERLRALYGAYLELQDARLHMDEALATSGHARALEMLFDALLEAIDTGQDLEKELAEARPVAYYSLLYDQVLTVKRHGLAAREAGLVRHLASIDGAPAWLAETGWSKARKSDKTKSIARRVAVLDALGITKDAAARPLFEEALRAPEPGLRIVAIEHLVPLGVETRDLLKPILDDPAPQVRRALFETLGRTGADESRWIPLALEGYRSQRGLVRARALEALAALTGAALPDEVAQWEALVEKHQEEIEAGTWKRPEPPSKEATESEAEGEKPDGAAKEGDGMGKDDPTPPRFQAEARTIFYGVGVPSIHVIFAFEGSTDMDLPADLTIQKKKAKRTWQGLAPGWRSEYVDHQTLLETELSDVMERMTDDARFATIHLWGGNPSRLPVMGDKKPLAPKKSTRKKVLKTLAKAKPQGQVSVEEATRLAFRLSGQSPLSNPKAGADLLDTVYLVSPGWNGGRWAIPEAMLADFERHNRFHRLQVNTIRITNRKAESEHLMRGLAAASGGTYHWLEKLP